MIKILRASTPALFIPSCLEKLSHIPFQSALDLGCGTGEMLKLILQKDPHKELCGIDLSEEMLAVAKSKLPEQVKLLLGDSEVLPFRSTPLMLCTATTLFIIILHRKMY